MAWHPTGAKPLPEPMLACYQLDPWQQTSVKFLSKYKYFDSRKCVWKCCHFCAGLKVSTLPLISCVHSIYITDMHMKCNLILDHISVITSCPNGLEANIVKIYLTNITITYDMYFVIFFCIWIYIYIIIIYICVCITQKQLKIDQSLKIKFGREFDIIDNLVKHRNCCLSIKISIPKLQQLHIEVWEW